ncbi:MAG: hypothetical protein QOG65_3404 [Actinomycetota bacterium]|nr:hypothetical protein [Actinomycetota bacterium]
MPSLRQRQGSPPVELELTGVTRGASVVPVGLDPGTGDLAVPGSATSVAWYEGGPAPGQYGIAVLAAHVDWHGQRGVFFNLRRVHVGDTAKVSLASGRTERFTITRRAQVAKTDLNRLLVGSRVGPPQLVLITCGGDFDWHTHHYADNVVLFARSS